MIFTVTLNPAVDRELTVAAIVFDEVLRASEFRVDAGGKGFNVSRMLKSLGESSVAIAFAGGYNGRILESELNALGIETDFIWIRGETRVNVSVVTQSGGHYLKVNEPGPKIEIANIEALIGRIGERVNANDWWVLSGSLSPGAPETIYATLASLIQSRGSNAIVDTSGAALRESCKASPFLIKPNAEELSALTGLPTQNHSQIADAVAVARKLGARNVLVSMGKDGAMLCDEQGAVAAQSPKIKERNPIGAGDSMLGGLVWGLAQGWSLRESLRWGLACGAASASLPGTSVGSREHVTSLVDQVLLTPIA
jgi:1-phosphofructokinase family hexose kinase